MGTQQLLISILAILVVGIAIVVGIFLFAHASAASNKDAIVNDLMNIGQYAYRYKLRPEPLGGGGRKYDGFVLPLNLRTNEDADFSDYTATSNTITFKAVSAYGYGTVEVTLDQSGVLSAFTFTGDFQ